MKTSWRSPKELPFPSTGSGSLEPYERLTSLGSAIDYWTGSQWVRKNGVVCANQHVLEWKPLTLEHYTKLLNCRV